MIELQFLYSCISSLLTALTFKFTSNQFMFIHTFEHTHTEECISFLKKES